MELSPKTAFISLVVCVIYSGTGAVVQGPTPVSILAPVGLSFVDFTCNVNLSELPENTFYNAIRWRVNGNILTRMGQAVSGNTVSLQVTTSYISAAASVQCSTKLNGTIEVFSDTTATLTAYGPPEAPSNITSTQSSSNALILSWSAPSSPVQLHYTVTVTNTNSTSTTTITMFNNSSTNITITKDLMTAINSTECDYYTFSVTATNPAGNNTANIIAPVTFVPDPEDAQYNVYVSSDNTTMITFQPLEGYQYSLNNESQCSNTTSSITNGLTVFQIPYPHNCTVLTVLAEHNCTEGMIPVNISNVTTQCSVQPSPSTISMSPSSSTTVGPPGMQIWRIIVPVVAVLLLVAVTAVIAIIVLLRQRNRKKKPSRSILTEDEKTRDKSIPLQQNMPQLPDLHEKTQYKDDDKNGNTSSTLKAPQQKTECPNTGLKLQGEANNNCNNIV